MGSNALYRKLINKYIIDHLFNGFDACIIVDHRKKGTCYVAPWPCSLQFLPYFIQEESMMEVIEKCLIKSIELPPPHCTIKYPMVCQIVIRLAITLANVTAGFTCPPLDAANI